MSCSLYAWLGERSPKISNELLAFDLTCGLVDEDGEAVKVEPVPTEQGARLDLCWGGWGVSIAYEEGSPVADDAARFALPAAGLAGDRRLRLDCQRRETAQQERKLQRLTAFLQQIYGAVVVDVSPRELA